MPKVADVMKDVTKDVKFNTHIEKVLSTTSSKIPSGAFIPTTIADLEKEIDIDLQEKISEIEENAKQIDEQIAEKVNQSKKISPCFILSR